MYQVQNQQYQSPTKVPGSCFRCNKPGHWARFCPESPLPRSPISPQPLITTSSDEFPATHCQCGAGLCEIRISKSTRNPDRKYYRCPGKYGRHCGYFKWCDQLKMEEVRRVQPESFPMCGCGAGVCSVKVEENAGRSYFICPIKKGEGACNFRQLLDNSPESTSIILEGLAPDKSTHCVFDDFDLNPEAEMQIDALQMVPFKNSVQGIQVHMLDDGDKMEGGACERPGKSPEAHPRGSQNKMIQTSDTMETPMHQFHMNNVQASAVRNNVADDETEMVDEVCERLVETQEAHPCVVDNNFSATLHREQTIQSCDTLKNRMVDVQQDNVKASVAATDAIVNNTVSEGSIPTFNPAPPVAPDNLFHRVGTQPWTEHLSNHSNILKDGDEGSIMTGIIIQTFQRSAQLLKNDLINLLESMRPQNHESMKKEADCIFAALDRLQVDHGPFQLRINEYIKQAASLYQIEQIINNDDASAQELADQHNNEQRRFDDILKAYCDAKDAFMESNRQLSLLCERASCPKDSLVELDKELSYCEAENRKRRDKLLQLTKTMAECREALEAASLNAAAAQKNSEKWKIERSAAEAKFQEARAQLRS